MPTDYDVLRASSVGYDEIESLEEFKGRRDNARSGLVDVDETESNEALELPGADLSGLSGDELTVRVLPKQRDEFTCSSCFLVHHHTSLARVGDRGPICRECR